MATRHGGETLFCDIFLGGSFGAWNIPSKKREPEFHLTRLEDLKDIMHFYFGCVLFACFDDLFDDTFYDTL